MKLARESHPDRNPIEKKAESEKRFNRINQAYKVLSDGRKRSIYDKFGEAGLADSGFCDSQNYDNSPSTSTGSSPAAGRSSSEQEQSKKPQKKNLKKGKNVIHELKLTLEEFYAGTARKLVITRKTSCWTCDGNGGTGVLRKCQLCFGQAFFGPGKNFTVEFLKIFQILHIWLFCHFLEDFFILFDILPRFLAYFLNFWHFSLISEIFPLIFDSFLGYFLFYWNSWLLLSFLTKI